MKIMSWIRDMLFWKKQFRNPDIKSPLEMIDYTSELFCNTVKETSEVSQKLLQKLEKVEHDLQDREELLDVIFQTIPDFLLLKDGDGRWILLNSYGKKLYGIRAREYKNKTDREIAEQICPWYLEELNRCVETDEQAWISKRSNQYEEIFEDPNGRKYVFDVTKTPIYNDDGSRKYLLVHGRNITEEVENSKHITMLIKALNHASDSIAVTDHLHRILYANEAFCTTYGYDINELLMKPMNLVSSGQTPRFIYEEMSKTITSGEVWTGVLTNRKKNGDTFQEIVTISPVLNGKPYPVYYISVKRLLERRSTPR